MRNEDRDNHRNNNRDVIKAGALVTDTSPIDQPENTVRYALNAVPESNDGDRGNRIVENSNSPCFSVPTGFIPMGSIYVGDEETIQFYCDSTGSTIIQLLDRECNTREVFNDSLQEIKLGLSVQHQVHGIYRLRLGCEKCIYFTDGNIKLQYFNFSKPENFKVEGNDTLWDISKFLMIKEYQKIPKFDEVTVLDSGGAIEPGSVNITIQYVDEGLNPSEWITSSPVINIYNDSTSKAFLKINGSINSEEEALNFPTTTKAIKVIMDNLDTSYPFYRLGFLEANASTGKINQVKYTELIPTSKNFFIYTGENFVSLGSVEEVAFFTFFISSARVIEQIENRVTVHNVKGLRANFCNLQKYASRIKADVELKKVLLNDINDPRNNKNPTMQFGDMLTGGLGHFPGEIYSYGIVYQFLGGAVSPVFHIPGKNPFIDNKTVFSPGENIRPMSNIGNTSVNNKYIDNDTCSNNIYWGKDSEGRNLEGDYVRHHKFPSRSELGIPLFKEESTSEEQISTYYKLQLLVTGNTTMPEECITDPVTEITEDCAPSFSVRITYTVDGVEDQFSFLIQPSQISNPVNEEMFTTLFTSNNIIVIEIAETVNGTDFTVLAQGATSPKGLKYNTSVISAVFTSESKLYSTQIMGIKFSGIDIPPITETNGEQIIGYYIVRNERTENEKTILDSGVLVPTIKNDKYTSHGLLNPEIEDSKIDTQVVALIHPEHKFKNKEYTNFEYIRQEGNFEIYKTNKSRISYNDVLDGSSYDSGPHKDGNDDGKKADKKPDTKGLDGWSLKVIVRDNYTRFKSKLGFNILKNNVDENFYLNAVESRVSKDDNKVIYNIASDNKIGIITLKSPLNEILTDRLPYVIMGRTVLDPYSNYRLLPYYKTSLNLETNSTSSTFGGDTYIAPMRYVNTVFWENRVARRANRTSGWSYIAGIALVLGGAALAIFTGGTSLYLAAAGVALLGAGTLFVSSGIKMDAIAKAYGEDYGKGLRETALDNFVKEEYRPTTKATGKSGPSDDTIQWIGDAITDLWFETSVNIQLRNSMTSTLPTFLNAPGVQESGNDSPQKIWEFFGLWYQKSNPSRYPISKLEIHLASKLLIYDDTRNDSRLYLGTALGEYYNVNPDYERINKEKLFYHLALEYDCCSECQEDFPHRVHYSEQSYQEELTDNYRIFLPNNYRDIEGETGQIIDAFRFGNNLFIHTEEALWLLPNTQQERVTGNVVSFIGTGDFFALPPKKIVDDRNSSAGTLHRSARIKTRNGVFFPSYREKKWYLFDGQRLNPISDLGNYSLFKEIMQFKFLSSFYNNNLKNYPHFDNPSNAIGIGYLSAYDTKLERLLITKKDYVITNLINETGYELCNNGSTSVIFRNIQEIIFNKVNNGYTYLGIEKCRLKFSKIEKEIIIEEREVISNVPNNAHVYVAYDTSGSFSTDTYLADLKTSVRAWYLSFRPNDINFDMLHEINDGTERYLFVATNIANLNSEHGGKVLFISLCNEASPYYHAGSMSNPVVNQPTITPEITNYTEDYNNFIAVYEESFSFFKAINYTIATIGAPYNNSLAFIQQNLLAYNGLSFSQSELENINYNTAYTIQQWNNLKDSLLLENPYETLGLGLRQFGWILKTDRNDLAVIAGEQSSIITVEQFSEDINSLLISDVIEIIDVEVEQLVTTYEYVEGEPFIPIILNNSWTLSYSLKDTLWVSFHSYLPDYYMYVQDKFYSWKNGLVNLYKHNQKNNYRTFYSIEYPFIIEIVDNAGPLQTKITDFITFQTDATKFDEQVEEFINMERVTFNKLLVYNSKQISGLLNLELKNIEEDYMRNQIVNSSSTIRVERKEKDWRVNELRDIRIDNTKPMFKKDLPSLQPNYFNDKIVNQDVIDFNKNWQQMESFRDKYLVIRLIFDNFTDVKLVSSFIVPNKNLSER